MNAHGLFFNHLTTGYNMDYEHQNKDLILKLLEHQQKLNLLVTLLSHMPKDKAKDVFKYATGIDLDTIEKML